MNRRDLFKRAGKLGLGLGLGAVVGKGLIDEGPTAPRVMKEAIVPPLTAHKIDGPQPIQIVDQWQHTLIIDEHKYKAFEVETFTFAGDGKAVRL